MFAESVQTYMTGGLLGERIATSLRHVRFIADRHRDDVSQCICERDGYKKVTGLTFSGSLSSTSGGAQPCRMPLFDQARLVRRGSST